MNAANATAIGGGAAGRLRAAKTVPTTLAPSKTTADPAQNVCAPRLFVEEFTVPSLDESADFCGDASVEAFELFEESLEFLEESFEFFDESPELFEELLEPLFPESDFDCPSPEASRRPGTATAPVDNTNATTSRPQRRGQRSEAVALRGIESFIGGCRQEFRQWSR